MSIRNPGDNFAGCKDVLFTERNERLVLVLGRDQHFYKVRGILKVDLVQHVGVDLDHFLEQGLLFLLVS